jgi:hypothetical protein
MKDLRDWLLIVLFLIIGILLLLRGCTPKPIESVLKHTRDTIRTIQTDTVWPEPKIITKYIQIGKPTSSTTAPGVIVCNKINTYSDSLVDSNIVIKNIQIVQGELKNHIISYKLLIPKYITKTINTTIYDSIITTKYRQPCFSFYGGLEIGGNTSQLSNIKPFIGTRWKTTYYTYGYNVINQTHNIGIAVNLFNIK